MGFKTILAVTSLGLVGVGAVAAEPRARQAELDRIVSRVNDKIITQSDIRQAALLKLVEDSSSEDTTRRGLENRMLILAEIARLPALPPSTASDFSARRSEWEAAVGGHGRVADLLGRTAMSENGLESWLRDDVRIQMHIKRQFGNAADADRAKLTGDWIARLRQRAGLK